MKSYAFNSTFEDRWAGDSNSGTKTWPKFHLDVKIQARVPPEPENAQPKFHFLCDGAQVFRFDLAHVAPLNAMGLFTLLPKGRHPKI